MNKECLCDLSSEEYSEEKKFEEEPILPCNRICLNFTREFRNPAKDKYNIAKVKELFKVISERQDLQEMKVSGWLDEGKESLDADYQSDEEKDDCREVIDSELDDNEDECSEKGVGQRFAMSRDFWYRKLNTLKAQKLDEAALEAKDLPPDNKRQDEINCAKYIRNQKIYSSDVPEKKEEILKEIDDFDESVAKPMEKKLRKRFLNIYENRNHFKMTCDD